MWSVSDQEKTIITKYADTDYRIKKSNSLVIDLYRFNCFLFVTFLRCRPWFIRCLKPNTSKSAMMFDTDVISEQIKATGILETVKIRSAGYPVHMHPGAFLER